MGDNRVLLSLRGVKTYFPVRKGVFRRTVAHVKAVDGVDLDVYEGETLGLVGESGCGKSTLGRSILQLTETSGGEIWYDSGEGRKNLCTISRREMNWARRKMQIVFQDPHSSLNPAFTVFGSLQDPLRKFGIKSRVERRKIVGDLLESVNMRREYMDRYPHELSGGQRQRIGIARALCVDPALVVCDEAVSALDVSIRAQVLNLLLELKKQRSLTYLFISHDLSVVEYVSDRIAVMYLGKIVELADSDVLYAEARHPYTQALLSAIPVVDPERKTRRIVLEGDVPSPVNPPSGCPFHPRCRYRMDRCTTEVPLLRKYVKNGRDHFVSCHLAEE